MKPRAVLVFLSFLPLVGCFALIAKHFGIAIEPPIALSFVLLLAPYWGFGFGLDRWLRARLSNRSARVLAPLSLMAAYLVFALPSGQFRGALFAGMAAIVLAISLLLEHAGLTAKDRPGWHDWLILAILGISVDLHFFVNAWPVAGLSGMSKLLFVDAGLYGYLVLRPLPNTGFDFRLRLSDFRTGLREFLWYTPIAIALGFALRFLHFHPVPGNPLAFAAGWLFTLFFVALPEELFFRGLMLKRILRRFCMNLRRSYVRVEDVKMTFGQIPRRRRGRE